VNDEQAPYDRDPEAWNAYLAEGNARQARKRVSVDVLIRDQHGRMLLVDPVYKPGWDLPGGIAEANEPPRETARRELREELGLDIRPGQLLSIAWAAPHGPWDDILNLIFDGGALTDDQIAVLHLTDDELRDFEFCDDHQASERLSPTTWRRIRSAAEAIADGHTAYTEDYRDARNPLDKDRNN
jgi:8-oxo-dGTP diphosphatase